VGLSGLAVAEVNIVADVKVVAPTPKKRKFE
jgi:hypothetical protein